VNALEIMKYGIAIGIAYAAFWQLRRDVNNIGKIMRGDERKAERRWKHQVATQIENSTTLDEAKRYAELLRQDAYRD
jgi:hypothetical protein